jgi:hypothetical protein
VCRQNVVYFDKWIIFQVSFHVCLVILSIWKLQIFMLYFLSTLLFQVYLQTPYFEGWCPIFRLFCLKCKFSDLGYWIILQTGHEYVSHKRDYVTEAHNSTSLKTQLAAGKNIFRKLSKNNMLCKFLNSVFYTWFSSEL